MTPTIPTRRVATVLGLSVAAVSTAAVLVRLVPTMDPIAIAFWRTAIVAVLIYALLARRRRCCGGGKQRSGKDE